MATCRPIPTPALPWLQPRDIALFTTLPTRPSYPVAAAAMLWVQPMEIAPLPTRQSAIPPRQPREAVIPSTPDQLYSHMATPWLVAPPTVGLARRPETCVPAKDPIQRTFQTRICQHPRATTYSLTTPTLRSRTARARMGRYHIHGDHWVNSSLLRARTARIRMDRCRIRGAQWVNISLLRTCPARIRMGRAPRGKPIELRVDMGMPQGNVPIFSPRMSCLPMARVHMDRTPNIRTLTSPIQVPRGRLQLLRAPLLKVWRRRVNIVATQLLRPPRRLPCTTRLLETPSLAGQLRE